MNRIRFYVENGEVKTERQHIIRLKTNDEAKKVFKVKEKACYLQIFFLTPMTEEELERLYRQLMLYDIVKLTEEQLAELISSDLKSPLGNWEFRCKEFTKAFEFALAIMSGFGGDPEERFTLQISDEPTETMKEWLKKKDTKKIQKIMLDLDEKINNHKYADISTGAEKEWDCSRQTFMTAVQRMQKSGYAVRHLYFNNKAWSVKIITDDDLNWKVEAPLIKRDILKKMAESREEHAE